MSSTRNIQIFHDTIVRLLHRGATKNIEKILEKAHAADLAQVIRSLDDLKDKQAVFGLIAVVGKKAETLQVLEPNEAISLLENQEEDKIIEIFQQMPSDRVTDIMGYLPEEVSQALLKRMEPKGSEVIEELMRYPEDTAGGIMTTEFCALQEETTVEQAIRRLQTEMDLDHIFYVYVVNEVGQLVGVLSLRKLLQVKPETKIKEMMITDVISVRTDADQEEAAKVVARYNLLALPVVNENNKLIGIVTVDDVVDVIRDEATEDILKMGGVGEAQALEPSIFKSARIRLPWLFISLLGGIIAFKVVNSFQLTLEKSIILVCFIPLIVGMTGNVATQTATIVVRGLSTGKIRPKQIGWILWKELKVGLLLGGLYGLIAGTFASIQPGNSFGHLGLAIGGGLAIAMIVAAALGSFLPMIFERFKIDPAFATGPFVTTIVDVIGIFIYFELASLIHGIHGVF